MFFIVKFYIVRTIRLVLNTYFFRGLGLFFLMDIVFSKEIKKHKKAGYPILALESTILAHGMPFPENYAFAKRVEKNCRKKGVAPATIAVINGRFHVGLNQMELKRVCQSKNILKLSKRDLPFALSEKQSGATTVSATIWIAYKAGLLVFSTGGIGGVHRVLDNNLDISQDLVSLSETPVITVSSGAKSILDLPKTVESLEALGIPVVGYKTSFFPAFYTSSSGIKVPNTIKTAKQASLLFLNHLKVGLKSSLLIVNPIPKKKEIPKEEIDILVNDSLSKAIENNIKGKDLTPFLLKKIVQKTDGGSLSANIALAENNIAVGAKIAKQLYNRDNLSSNVLRNRV